MSPRAGCCSTSAGTPHEPPSSSVMDGASELPFGGYKQSGLGRELGRHAVEDYTETKTLNMHIGARTNWWMPKRETLG